jgi:hypothetical protein
MATLLGFKPIECFGSLSALVWSWVRFKLMFLDCLRLHAATRHQLTAPIPLTWATPWGKVKPKISPEDTPFQVKCFMRLFLEY